MTNSTDIRLLRHTLELAHRARKQGADPFAAILVRENRIVKQVTDRSLELCDPTYHAELGAISEYCRENRVITLEGFSIYCSTEPCPMCSGAIHWARISRVIFSVSQRMLCDITGSIDHQPSSEEIVTYNNRKVEFIGPLLPVEGLAVFDGFEFASKATRLQRWAVHHPIARDRKPVDSMD